MSKIIVNCISVLLLCVMFIGEFIITVRHKQNIKEWFYSFINFVKETNKERRSA